jgi:hypothetical protein
MESWGGGWGRPGGFQAALLLLVPDAGPGADEHLGLTDGYVEYVEIVGNVWIVGSVNGKNDWDALTRQRTDLPGIVQRDGRRPGPGEMQCAALLTVVNFTG